MVTQQNKMQYLDSLAQYRLRTRVSGEIDAFLKGMQSSVMQDVVFFNVASVIVTLSDSELRISQLELVPQVNEE